MTTYVYEHVCACSRKGERVFYRPDVKDGVEHQVRLVCEESKMELKLVTTDAVVVLDRD